MIIGITGGSGSGKSTLLRLIGRLGGKVLDCDEVYHALLAGDAALLQAIEARFPGTVTAGKLDRKALGERVFSDERALEALNRITHGAVKNAVLEQLEGHSALAAIDAIALIESGLAELCDITVAVTAPEDMRLHRLMARDGITEEYARLRMAAQHSDTWFRENCDYVLENGGAEADFRAKCIAFLENIGIIKEKTQEVEKS